jgi:hypothetical protein
MSQASPTVRLASLLLERDLGEWAQELRNDERSWSYIARKLAELTDVSMTAETLRRLYGPSAKADVSHATTAAGG